jgi:hypothetical protein
VLSAPGEGSTFAFTLPRHPRERLAASTPEIAGIESGTVGRG